MKINEKEKACVYFCGLGKATRSRISHATDHAYSASPQGKEGVWGHPKPVLADCQKAVL